jgi:hypothetical protein
LKSIVCLVTNPHAIEPPGLLSLREKQNFTVQDYCNLFFELMAILDSFGLILCSIAVENLPAQVGGVDRALQLNNSPAIHVKCFAQMANRVLASTGSTANFARIMDYLTDLQKLLRSPQATVQLGAKCPKSVRTRWFSLVDTLRFISKPLIGIRFAIGTLEAGLRAQVARFSPVRTAHDDHEKAEGSDGDQIFDEESRDIGEDSDSEST